MSEPLRPVTGMSRAEMRSFLARGREESQRRMLSQHVAVFDWYSASIDEDPTVIVESLATWLGAGWRATKGRFAYTAGAELVRDGNVVARVIYGGNEEANPVAWASGEDTGPFVEAVRTLWPSHGVTRVDAAFDFKVGEPWNRLYELAVHVADFLPDGSQRKKRIGLTTIGDWLREDLGWPDGRTLYIGSMKSPVMARLYEKGKQMRKAFPDQADKYPAGWVRLELQVRPEKGARYEAATLTPDEVWGTSAWARQLHKDVFSSELAKVTMVYKRPQDDARAWSFFLRQYGPMMVRRYEQAAKAGADPLEVWAELGREIGRNLMADVPAEDPAPSSAADRSASVRHVVALPPVGDTPAPFDGERIGPDSSSGQWIDVHERAASAVQHLAAMAAPVDVFDPPEGWDAHGPEGVTPVL